MDEQKSVDKFFTCACYGEGVRFTYWPDDKSVYLSLWKYRSYGETCWRQRLRHIWNIIKTGEPWLDEVVLSADEAKAMGQYLVSLDDKHVI